MRAAIYAYAAPAEQDCQVELQQLREFCARRGWQVVEEYADVCSRKTKAGRAELNRLLRDAGRKQFECVLVCRLERFGPSLLQTVVQIAKLAKVGVRFLAAEQVLDTEGWTCGQWDILRAAAEFERQGFSQKVKAGMAAAKQQGKRIGRPRLSSDHARRRRLHSQDRGCTGGESHHDSPYYSIRRRDAGGELISIRLPRSSRLCARRGRRRLRLQLPSRVVEQKGSLLAHSSGYREQKPPFWRSIRAAVLVRHPAGSPRQQPLDAMRPRSGGEMSTS